MPTLVSVQVMVVPFIVCVRLRLASEVTRCVECRRQLSIVVRRPRLSPVLIRLVTSGLMLFSRPRLKVLMSLVLVRKWLPVLCMFLEMIMM